MILTGTAHEHAKSILTSPVPALVPNDHPRAETSQRIPHPHHATGHTMSYLLLLTTLTALKLFLSVTLALEFTNPRPPEPLNVSAPIDVTWTADSPSGRISQSRDYFDLWFFGRRSSGDRFSTSTYPLFPFPFPFSLGSRPPFLPCLFCPLFPLPVHATHLSPQGDATDESSIQTTTSPVASRSRTRRRPSHGTLASR